jgi:hypothetical protein
MSLCKSVQLGDKRAAIFCTGTLRLCLAALQNGHPVGRGGLYCADQPNQDLLTGRTQERCF